MWYSVHNQAGQIGRGDQLSPSFLKISRNGRMPAIVDHEPLGGSAPLTIFESGAIMMYLAEKAGRFWPQEPHHKYEVVQWILWQMANQGPKFGEQGHFHRAAQDPKNGDQAYADLRFDNPDGVNDSWNKFWPRIYNRYSSAPMRTSFPWRMPKIKTKDSVAEQGEFELSGDFIKRSVGHPISPRRYRDSQRHWQIYATTTRDAKFFQPGSSSAEPRPFAAASGDSGH